MWNMINFVLGRRRTCFELRNAEIAVIALGLVLQDLSSFPREVWCEGVGGQMAQMVEDWYKQMPVITRSYLTLSVLTTIGCALEVISPYHIYLNFDKVIRHFQYWRLITNFFYFGRLDLDFLFHMFFLGRYCKSLEETSFRGRTADFFYMLFFGGVMLTGVVLVGGMFQVVSQSLARIYFLSNSLTFMMVYVWSKRNPHVHMSFLGLFTFTAPYLPWVLLGFAVLVGSSPWVDLLGILAGHAYYFLEDVYPLLSGRRVLKTPGLIKALFPEDVVVVPRPGNRGFAGVDAGDGPGQDVQRAF